MEITAARARCGIRLLRSPVSGRQEGSYKYSLQLALATSGSRVEYGFVNLMWDLGSGPHSGLWRGFRVMDTALEAGSSVLCGEEDPLAE